MSDKIYGVYEKTLKRDEKNAFTCFSLKVSEPLKEKNRYGCIICYAHIPLFPQGIPVCVEGDWEENERGKVFVVSSINEEPWDKASTVIYLASSCKGISYKTARKIVDLYGKELFTHMRSTDFAYELSNKIKHLNVETAVKLCDSIATTSAQRELFNFLFRFGVAYPNALKLFNEYGLSAKQEICKNPYEIGMKHGLTFRQCDEIAKNEHFSAASHPRLCAAIVACLERNVTAGHTYMYQQALQDAVKDLFEKTSGELMPDSVIVSGLHNNKNLQLEFDELNRVFLKRIRVAEIMVAMQIRRLMTSGVELPFSETLIEKCENECNIRYASQQKEAFSCLKKSGLAIITGGPGTGKTTTINGIISAYEKMFPNNKISLCAPTGRAAQRMTESTGKEAVTIHKLLDYRPFGESGVIHKTTDNPIDADCIVVDEASMLDIELASIFFSAIRSGTLVLLVGDVNQLPSVGAGDVLNDLINSERIPVFQLKTVYRQAAQSPIVMNANYINCGECELMKNDEFQMIFKEQAEDMAGEIVKAVKKYHNFSNPFETQVLAPTHKGPAGVTALNTSLQDLLNPHKQNELEIKYGNKTYRKNDKVIMLVNNYDKGYFNGDIGYVKKITESSMLVSLFDRDVEITRDLMDEINLAYALTIHKSQGSEFRNVIISLPYKPAIMLKRNLLYTGITRAKEKVIVVSEYGAVDKAIKTKETGKRRTRLLTRLTEVLPELNEER